MAYAIANEQHIRNQDGGFSSSNALNPQYLRDTFDLLER